MITNFYKNIIIKIKYFEKLYSNNLELGHIKNFDFVELIK